MKNYLAKVLPIKSTRYVHVRAGTMLSDSKLDSPPGLAGQIQILLLFEADGPSKQYDSESSERLGQ